MKKPLKLKVSMTLAEKEQDKRDAVLESMGRQGLPEQVVDSFIYRVGLDSTFTETQTGNEAVQPQNEGKHERKE